MSKRGKWWRVAAASSLVLLAALRADAALVAIDPVKLSLTGATPSASISLRNNGAERVRFQVSAFTWQQSVSGEMQLAPTQALVFFPSMLEIAPGETRRVRVTTTEQVASNERSYRLFADELPPLASAPGAGVRVLTRFGIPVFQRPDAPHSRPVLKLALRGRHLAVSLQNTGNAHFVAQSVRVVGKAADGSSLLQQDLPAWYVLAQGRRDYDVAVSEEICSKLSQLSANANTDNGSARTDYNVPADACKAL